MIGIGKAYDFRNWSRKGNGPEPNWAGPDRPNSQNVTLNGDGLGLFLGGSPGSLAKCTPGTPGCVEQDYGYLCGQHDWGTGPWCNNMSDPTQLNSWCADIYLVLRR